LVLALSPRPVNSGVRPIDSAYSEGLNNDMLNRVTYLLVILLLATSLYAQSDPWRFVVTDQKYSYYVDTRRVSRIREGTLIVWMKVFWRYTAEGYTQKQEYITQVLLPRVDAEKARKAEYIVYREEFDCVARRYRVLSSLVYDSSKSLIFSPSAATPTEYPLPWVAGTSEGADGSLLDAVCALRPRKQRN
jgi:hypothetical protein